MEDDTNPFLERYYNDDFGFLDLSNQEGRKTISIEEYDKFKKMERKYRIIEHANKKWTFDNNIKKWKVVTKDWLKEKEKAEKECDFKLFPKFKPWEKGVDNGR